MKYYQFFKINNNKNNSDQTINKKKIIKIITHLTTACSDIKIINNKSM